MGRENIVIVWDKSSVIFIDVFHFKADFFYGRKFRLVFNYATWQPLKSDACTKNYTIKASRFFYLLVWNIFGKQ